VLRRVRSRDLTNVAQRSGRIVVNAANPTPVFRKIVGQFPAEV